MWRFMVLATLLLSSCSGSGFWRYEEDTFDVPWHNPNQPAGSSENFQLSRHGATSQPAPLLTEAGDIWPGPPQPVPTLKDLQKQQMAEINNQSATPTGGLAPLPPLPSLPGYEIPAQDITHPVPQQVFPGGSVHEGARNVSIGGGEALTGGETTKSGMPSPIIVPNGNGTSTVIGPTGTVTTIPTPGK